MKKNILYSFIVFVGLVFFSACGTDSKENPPEPDGPYSFFNASTPVVITEPVELNGTVTGTDFNITVQLLKNGFVEAGATLEMKPFDFKYGSVTDTIVETDENGLAKFDYVAPTGSDYTAIKGQDFTVEAVFKDPDAEITSSNSAPTVLISQEFVLQFR